MEVNIKNSKAVFFDAFYEDGTLKTSDAPIGNKSSNTASGYNWMCPACEEIDLKKIIAALNPENAKYKIEIILEKIK